MAEELTPQANKGLYETAEPNTEVLIWSGRVRVTAGGRVSGIGQMALSWLPTPTLRFELEGSPSGRLANDGEVLLWGQHAKGRCIITQQPLLPDMPGRIEGLINGPMALGGDPEVARMVVHLVNFPDFVGSPIEVGPRHWVHGRVVLSTSGWRFTIDEHPDSDRVFASLHTSGGYGITHVGVLEKEDGTPFHPSEAKDRILGLGAFLSFAAGAWAYPQLPVGIAVDGRQVYREGGVRQAGPWRGRFRWFNDLDGAALEGLFAGFDRLWAKSEWREPLRKLIYLWVEANDRAPDVGLVLAQAALEQMAWHLLVNDRGVLSRGAFKDLKAAGQLRRLVKDSGIPLDTPSDLKRLTGMTTSGRQPIDGPDWIAQLRNDFVHPPRGGQSARTSGRMVDAWLLSMWYLELALLSLMDFKGDYRSRLNAGEVSRLPWS